MARPKPPVMNADRPVKMPPFKIPKKDGDLADLMYELKQEEARVKAALAESPLSVQLAEIQRRRAALEEHCIENLSKNTGAGAIGQIARVEVYTKAVPVVDTQNNGWDALYKHIKKTGNFHLLARSLATGAVNEIIEDGGKLPPGVTLFNQVKVSLTKKPTR